MLVDASIGAYCLVVAFAACNVGVTHLPES
jgi:hypothetical protein